MDVEALKKRAERFGMNVSSVSKKVQFFYIALLHSSTVVLLLLLVRLRYI